MIIKATDQFVMSSSMSWEVWVSFQNVLIVWGLLKDCWTYVDVDPFLLREGLVLVHEDSFRHGRRNAVLKGFASKIL